MEFYAFTKSLLSRKSNYYLGGAFALEVKIEVYLFNLFNIFIKNRYLIAFFIAIIWQFTKKFKKIPL